MLTKNIIFKNFGIKKKSVEINRDLKKLLDENNEIINSLKSNYKDSFNKLNIKKIKKYKNFKLIGMGGSILGAESIYNFFKKKIKKNFIFINNLTFEKKKIKKKSLNLIFSKSGNTIETIVNSNIYINKTDTNLFCMDNQNNSLGLLAKKLKAEVITHNNFIGGRYSVLSEVGMLPAELMGLKSKEFRQLNNLIKSKVFLKNLIENVSSTLFFLKQRKFNSIIINYDDKSDSLFLWYQQLLAESIGKKNNSLLPILSNMPKDNHSVMQLYLDGYKNNFFTFFYVNDKDSIKINNHKLASKNDFLKNKKISEILYAQIMGTQKVFQNKKIPFRSFYIKERNEKTLGELFCFFILETILIGRALKINPYDQPSVELIKNQTMKILIK